MNEWQPIETAPKDGTDFLAFDGEYICVVHMNKGMFLVINPDCCCCSGSCVFKPTHWMPLPKPPIKIIHECGDDYFKCCHGEKPFRMFEKKYDCNGIDIGFFYLTEFPYCPFCGEKA